MSTWLSYLFPPSGGTHTIPTAKLEEPLSDLLRSINPTVEEPLAIAFRDMALVREEATEKSSKTLFVSTKGEEKILRVIDPTQAEKNHVVLDSHRVGWDWEIFRHDGTLEGAVAYDKYYRRMVYLHKDRVLQALNSPFSVNLVLCATLSSAKEVQYHHPIFPEGTFGQFLRAYPYSPLRNSLLFSLAFHYKGFKIDSLLGTGSFNTVWAISYIGKNDKPTQSALRIPKRLNPSRGKEAQMRSMDRTNFGGEFAQYVPNDPTILRFDDALVINEKDQFEFLTRDQVCGYFRDRSSIGERNFILLASIGEYLPGAVPLDEYLKKNRLSEKVIVSALRQLLLALADLNELQIIHRDLKPGNILVIEHGEDLLFKLFDFGLSYVVSKTEELSKSTLMSNLAETRCGTPMTMAPELLREGKYGFAADLYGVGCILYELIFGEHFRNRCRTIRDVGKHSRKDHTGFLTVKMDAEEVKERFPEHHEPLKRLLIALLSQEGEERPPPLAALDPFITDPPPKPIGSWKFHHLLFLGGAIFVAYQIGKKIFERMQPPLEDAPIIYCVQK